ncbi:lipase family protein [Microbacterium sp. MPKO10]|uniref:lipase family protein n=1 Tax=Microbacterium sp. MPKO10 TaxID=2989818 RepID=UPI0022355EA3|nr:lipase family protein [Microbacterium sp. MPKO10]MCW4459111.1 lipase family protein [Microbacterium sp. MPKO10]
MTLTIGRPTMVDTDEITTFGEQLASVSLECGIASAEASAARVMTAPPNSSARWSTAGGRIDRAAEQLATASDQAAAVSRALGATAALYLETETTVSGLFATASSVTGAVGGALFGHMVLPLLGASAFAAAPAIAMTFLNPTARNAMGRATSVLGSKVTTWLGAHPGVARSPLAMMLVRGLVSGSDDTVKSALGMPPLLSPMINNPALSVPGMAVGLGALGVPGLGESRVTVTPVGHTAVTAPRTVSDLASRIPAARPGAPQIRIDEYGDGDSWVVYVGGTVDMFGEGEEAFDMESNVALMADADGGGYRAVEQAMADAGIDPDDSVTIVGHSQGGLIAERITQSGEYNVQTLVTFGAPSTGADLPDGVNAYAIEHSGDVIPALGGFTDGGDRIVVTGDAPEGGGDWLAPHHMSGYEQTASQVDASFDSRFGPLRSALGAIDGDGTSTTYHATRIDDPIPPAHADQGGGSWSAVETPHGSTRPDMAVRPQDAELRTDRLVPEQSMPPSTATDAELLGESGEHNLDAPEAGGAHDLGAAHDGAHDPGAPNDETLHGDGDGDGYREAGQADGTHVDSFGPQPSPLPLPDDVVRY